MLMLMCFLGSLQMGVRAQPVARRQSASGDGMPVPASTETPGGFQIPGFTGIGFAA